MTTPQVGDIWKSYYTDDRYEDTYYLIQTEPIDKVDGVLVYLCWNINFGTQERFHYFPDGKRQADDDCWEIMEKHS